MKGCEENKAWSSGREWEGVRALQCLYRRNPDTFFIRQDLGRRVVLMPPDIEAAWSLRTLFTESRDSTKDSWGKTHGDSWV